MKHKDQLLLEQSYGLVQAKQFLLSEGYTLDEINILIEKGKLWDTVKSVGKTVRNYGAIAAVTAAGMAATPDAQASPTDDLRKLNQGLEQKTDYIRNNSKDIVQGIMDKAGSDFQAKYDKEDAIINDAIQKCFGTTITQDGIAQVKLSLSNLDHTHAKDPKKIDIKIQAIQKAAKELKGNGSDSFKVRMAVYRAI